MLANPSAGRTTRLFLAARGRRSGSEPPLEKLLAALPGTPVVFAITDDRQLDFIHAGPGIVALCGMTPEFLGGAPLPVDSLLPAGEAERLLSLLAAAATGGGACQCEFQVRHPGRGKVWVAASLYPELREGGQVTWYGLWSDATESHRRREESRLRELAFYTLAESGADAILRYDCNCRRIYVNSVFARMAGLPAAALLGQRPSDYSLAEDALGYEAALRRVIADGQRVEMEYRWFAHDGRPLLTRMLLIPEYDDCGRVTSVLAVGRDITVLRQYEIAIRDIGQHDAVTGLPNRTYLDEYLGGALKESGVPSQPIGLLVLDLDHFKDINDIHGHQVGDRLLAELGQRLRLLTGDSGLVTRLGGDEFAVVQKRNTSVHGLSLLAAEIIARLAQPFVIDGLELFTSTCIGIAVSPNDGLDASGLLQYADTALYDAKKGGRGQFRFYSKELTVRTKERLALERALRDAVGNDELVLFYQPKVDLATLRILGAEALLRWQHPEQGLLSPDRFIQLAEETGLIVEIGLWVLREACLTARRLNQGGGEVFKVAVNLSPRQFRQGDLFESIWSILDETGCHPAWLELEVTESLLLEDDESVLSTFCALRELGITLAIDDFGTGYSALAYLKRFPIDVLKIDRSFIRDVTVDADSAELVKAIIAMARSLHLEVVAEGVEQEAEEAFLRRHGCALAQGYRYGRPLPLDEFPRAGER